MERAQNSESVTHVKKTNPTSRTDLRRKSLCYIFFGAPCTLFKSEKSQKVQETSLQSSEELIAGVKYGPK